MADTADDGPTPTAPCPLTERESRVWRALARALIVVPRALDTDLQRDSDMTINEYQALVILSESPDRRCRMTELANLIGLSASRMTRLVDAHQAVGFVEKVKSVKDGRGTVAVLTDAGFARLEQAYPAHLASVRARVMEPLADLDADELAAALDKLAGPGT